MPNEKQTSGKKILPSWRLQYHNFHLSRPICNFIMKPIDRDTKSYYNSNVRFRISNLRRFDDVKYA